HRIPSPVYGGGQGGGLERLRWRRREERDRLLDFHASAFRASMFLLALCVTTHHFKDIAAFRAVELINRHGAHPPGTSHRSVAYKTTLFLSGGGPSIPLPLWGGPSIPLPL